MVYINLDLMDLLKVTSQEYQVKIITQVLCLSPVDQKLVDRLLLVYRVAVISISINRSTMLN
jgi:hypothetical protein